MGKNPPAMQETQEICVQSLDREDPLEEGMATHPSIPAWKIPWTEEPGGLQFIGSQNTYIYIYIYMCVCVYIYIYIGGFPGG